MINVALLGFGVVGSGTAEVLDANRAQIEKYVGDAVAVKYILDLREFPNSPYASLIVHDYDIILNDPEVSIIAEMIGGAGVAYKFTKSALEAGKNVVTSNKELVARHGAELHSIAAAHGVRYLFEASVGGGIPIIRPMTNDLAANGIISVDGILNGTTNYILTRMTNEGAPLSDVLKDAQANGYAEADPTADIEGLDAARKIVILAALSFGKILDPDAISVEGITAVTSEDVKTAEALGYKIKLIAHTEQVGGKTLAMVSPRMVRSDNPLYSVEDVFNGILVEGNMLGKAMFYGRGAGKLPTASAVASDIIDIAANLGKASRPMKWEVATADDMADINDYSCVNVFIFEDVRCGVSKLEKVFGKIDRAVKSNGRVAFTAPTMTEREAAEKAANAGVPFVKKFRVI
ncbi:MAG: homoserine dehydrogenase [Clostridia bacterium]|nr:homoserine dehydrogenase [Clostridia bacterium]